jgi:transcriptional regulator GlxA family with amidase domain
LPKACDFLPDDAHVAFLVYPGFSLLNLSGPASAFDTANFELRMRGDEPFYAIAVTSPTEAGLA